MQLNAPAADSWGSIYEAYTCYRGWRFASIANAGARKSAVGADSPIHHVEVRVESSSPIDPVHPYLQWEAGVHRVQRVPLTSKLNKIHTGTVAVIIAPSYRRGSQLLATSLRSMLPLSAGICSHIVGTASSYITTVEVELDPEDLEWEVFRASGAGGQHVNKTESAVRVRHRPTGHVAACQADRSQHANRGKALQLLRAKLANEVARRQVETEMVEKRSQIGSLARSDRIRTYNYQQDRITDHRLGRSWSGLATVMRQGLPVVNETAFALDIAYKLAALASLDKPYFFMLIYCYLIHKRILFPDWSTALHSTLDTHQ
ncbi:unnamed protein product [Hydatigera taeniaeformis]|uniref:RF_PROK_I domain-containing protein n=1 Tax=Hydatigena taeniaeformis TaxID=6205 RepID=A0A0R3X716_HYDTA|nr:unnamed protein product [Hydatigera taeniaeformis]